MEPYNYTSSSPSPSSSSSLSHKPRVVIIGAGLCGISAAHHLFTMSPPNSFELTILEASARVGGRILTSTFDGQRVEMGATWIHGIEGSPIHGIATRVGSMQGHDTMPTHANDDDDDDVGVHEGDMSNNNMSMPWECMDGLPHDDPMVVSHGGAQVAPSLVRSVGHLYQNLFSLIQHTHGGGLQQFLNLGPHSSLVSQLTFMQLKEKLIIQLKDEASVGAYLEQGLQLYLSSKKEESKDIAHCNSTWTTGENEKLAIGVFRMREHVERSVTGADSLHHLSLAANEEYWEYPGEHLTIAKGYSSVVHSLAAELPRGTIQFNKKVKTIDWLNPYNPTHVVHVHCEDGSLVEADHVIITVSLGVLKAEALTTIEDNNGDEHKSLFQPPLPQWKQSAISKIGFGLVDKCFLAMKKPRNSIYPHVQFIFDEKEEANSTEGTNTSIPMWMRRNFSFYPIHKTSNVLCMWVIGCDALEVETLSDEEVIDGVMKTMESFGYREEKVISSHNENDAYTNKEPPQVEEILREKWGSNPLFRGSYSYVAIGSTGDDIDTLSEPLPRLSGGSCVDIGTGITSHIPRPLQLLFGGEATHRQCYSTTHGAFLSGVREAQRLMKHYGLLKGT